MSTVLPDLRNDGELIRLIKILTADESLLRYIKTLVLSRLTEEALLETNWLKAVIEYSVDDAISKLHLDKNIVSLKSNSLKMPNYSEQEPVTSNLKQHSTATGFSNTQQNNLTKETSPHSSRPRSAKFSTSRATMSAQDYMQQSEYVANNTELSPRRGPILIHDDNVLMESSPNKPYMTIHQEDELPNLSEDSIAVSDVEVENIEHRAESSESNESQSASESGSNMISNNNDISLQMEDFDSTPYEMTHDNDDNSMNDSETSVSRHVRFNANLESVLHVQNLLGDLDEEEQKQLFFTQFEGNRSNYCYQKQKEQAEQEGYASWSDWVSERTDEELSVLDEVYTKDFDEMFASRYLTSDDESEEEEEDYAYMENNMDDGYEFHNDFRIERGYDDDDDEQEEGEEEGIHDAMEDDWN